MTMFGLLAAIVAFFLFGLATDAHHGRWLRARPSATRKRVMRRGAWLLIAACFMLAVSAHGLVFGPVVGVGLVMLGAAVVFLTLNLVAPRGRAGQHPLHHVRQEKRS